MTSVRSPGELEPHWLGADEISNLIRSHDWSATPLGPIEGWPQSLCTAANLMLNAAHPMWIGWGPQATFLYNKAYLSVLGEAKHPWALGRPAAEVWAEIWDICGPLADKVFHRGEASFVDDVRLLMRRGDFLEETFYSFSYSPIRDESGEVAGLFCPSAETTAKVLTARRLATLSELAAKALVEKTTAAACRTAMLTMTRNAEDIPFALFYRLDGEEAQLLERVGMDAGNPLCPPTIRTQPSEDSPWPVREVLSSGKQIACPLSPQLGLSPVAGQSISQALVLPVTASGEEKPLGVLIVGVSPVRRLDAEYQTFFTLVAGQLAIAIANAKAYEEERRRAEVLAELDRAKTMFFSNISHELRTPLTLVLGPLDDALGRAADDIQKDHLQVVQRNARRLQKLVNTLLDFSRIQAGREQARYQLIDLAAFTSELASTFQSTIERGGLRYDVQCAPCEAYVDVVMWEKIVLNLISNAFKFTFEGGIEVRLTSAGDAAMLEVRDSGVGIPPSELPKIFERFHRVEGSRSRTHEGTGIGLALVHELVKLHGGEIRVESAPGKGTRFTVAVPLGYRHLPADRVSTGAKPSPAMAHSFLEESLQWAPEEQQVVAQDARAGVRSRVLVADDNADMRDYLQRLLAPHYEVLAAADGASALAKACAERPDLVISDVMMPGIGGFELLRQMREDDATREIPFILLSARAGEEARVEGLNAGADDYLVKPFSARELIARVDSQLKLLQLRRAAAEERETLHDVSRSLSTDLDASTLVQKITDAGTQLSRAKFGAFFYNSVDEHGEAFTLYTLSGAPREAFEKFGHPRPTPIFAPTFKGEATVRCFDVTKDPRFGQWGPHHGQPPGHLPVRSYLAVPVKSRTGEVLGGLFFGHPDAGVFDERSERLVEALAGHAAAAIDNARLYQAAKRAAEERRQLLESERAARAEAERLNASKDEFVATLSHELRTPLNSILGWSQILERPDLRGEDVRKAAEVIRRNARAQAQLIEDLLDISRITSGKLRLDVQSVSPHVFIEAAVEALRPAAEAKDIRVNVVVDPRAGPISGDPNRLQQVVWNLVSNSIKFTERGGKVQVLLERINSHVEISVADTGHGIPADFLPHVFERFRQHDGSSTRKSGGLGLGLAIVKHLVELHGGTVSARSDGLGRGSTFTVRLPVSVVQRAEVEERRHPGHSLAASFASGGINFNGTRVLIVDDDADARELVSRVLREAGAQVSPAANGAEALSLVGAQAFDVMISDIGMPEMDGFELMRHLRQRRISPPIRSIALTAFARSEDRTKALLAGFAAHLSKPVETAELLATLAAVTGRASD